MTSVKHFGNKRPFCRFREKDDEVWACNMTGSDCPVFEAADWPYCYERRAEPVAAEPAAPPAQSGCIDWFEVKRQKWNRFYKVIGSPRRFGEELEV